MSAVDEKPKSPMVSAINQSAYGSQPAAALRTQLAVGRKLDVRNPAVARQTAAHMLSELFFKPILAEMRDFPLGRELATGGQTESIFGSELDQRIADGVAASQPGLIKTMLKHFAAASQHEAQASAGPHDAQASAATLGQEVFA